MDAPKDDDQSLPGTARPGDPHDSDRAVMEPLQEPPAQALHGPRSGGHLGDEDAVALRLGAACPDRQVVREVADAELRGVDPGLGPSEPEFLEQGRPIGQP